MKISVTSRSVRIGRTARNVRSKAEDSTTAGGRAKAMAAGSVLGRGAKLIDTPKIQIAGDEYLNAIALRFDDGGWDVHRALQDLRDDIRRGGGVVDHGAVAARLHLGLDRPVDHGNQ